MHVEVSLGACVHSLQEPQQLFMLQIALTKFLQERVCLVPLLTSLDSLITCETELLVLESRGKVSFMLKMQQLCHI